LAPDDAEVNDPGVTTDRTIYRPNPPPSGKSTNINRQPDEHADDQSSENLLNMRWTQTN
jgi:hypothetical protein